MDNLEKDILDSISIICEKSKRQMPNLLLNIYHLLVLQMLPWKLSKKVLNYWFQNQNLQTGRQSRVWIPSLLLIIS